MTRFISASALLGLTLLLQPAAQAANWVAGKHYSVLPQAQRTKVAPGKVEVMEVFSYGCPACNYYRGTMKKLAASLPANAQMVYLPASWKANENWPAFQRAYLTAQALGVADKAHEAMYEAIWTTGELGIMDPQSGMPKSRLPSMEEIARFYQKVTGVKAADFVTATKSFSVDLKARQADAQIIAMQVSGTPTLVVNGKYRVNHDVVRNPDEVVALVKYLVAVESGTPPK